MHARTHTKQQAVRLFAELKDRGEDTPEVHSALVQAFCWCVFYCLVCLGNHFCLSLLARPSDMLIAWLSCLLPNSRWDLRPLHASPPDCPPHTSAGVCSLMSLKMATDTTFSPGASPPST